MAAEMAEQSYLTDFRWAQRSGFFRCKNDRPTWKLCEIYSVWANEILVMILCGTLYSSFLLQDQICYIIRNWLTTRDFVQVTDSTRILCYFLRIQVVSSCKISSKSVRWKVDIIFVSKFTPVGTILVSK